MAFPSQASGDEPRWGEPDAIGHVDASTPLYVDLPGKTYDAGPGGPLHAKDSGKPQHFRRDVQMFNVHVPQAVLNILSPPLVFTFVSATMSFREHYHYPRLVYVMALQGLIPFAIAVYWLKKSLKKGGSGIWPRCSCALFLIAFVTGGFFGELNYWFCMYPFFFLESLKTYTNIDPTEADGVRLMDAGKVHFSEGTRLATDMGMAFTTTWDIYCVAPITTAAGLPSQGSTLARYDMWAVGLNCCKASQPGFACGEWRNQRARSGLRQVGEEERAFFHLAVEQAEAEYNIRAPHPAFFYWVEDPHMHEGIYFQNGFASWVLANGIHFVTNVAMVFANVMLFHKPPTDKSLPPL